MVGGPSVPVVSRAGVKSLFMGGTMTAVPVTSPGVALLNVSSCFAHSSRRLVWALLSLWCSACVKSGVKYYQGERGKGEETEMGAWGGGG